MDLVQRVQEIVKEARDRQADPSNPLTAGGNVDLALVAWCSGLQNAIVEVALQVQKLTPPSQEESSVTYN